jgi:hypothetical protein
VDICFSVEGFKMFSKLKAWIMNKYLQSFLRNLGSRVIAWLVLIGVAPALAESFWANSVAVLIIIGEYLIDQYFSVKNAAKK